MAAGALCATTHSFNEWCTRSANTHAHSSLHCILATICILSIMPNSPIFWV